MFNLSPIPAFDDNYIWAFNIDPKTVVVVDPGEPNAVLRYLSRNDFTLAAILITHHHNDHTGGIKELTQQFDVPVYGPKNSPCQLISHPLTEGDKLVLGQLKFSILEVPAHTLDHIAYVKEEAPYWLFCGDTLFMGGCGRLFEGTAAQMLAAMDKFSQLPSETLVCCAHEYTLSNLSFALKADPDNEALKTLRERCEAQRRKGVPTLPSTIGTEQRINPFMRTQEASIRHNSCLHAGKITNERAEILAILREWKNHS